VTHRVLKEKPAMNYRLDKNQSNLQSHVKLNVQLVNQDLKEFRVPQEILEMLEKEVLQVGLVPLENQAMKAELECQEKLEDLVFKEPLA
jgi:hypothetical protein